MDRRAGQSEGEAADEGPALESARKLFATQAWADAHAAFAAIEDEGELPLDDLERMAFAAGLHGDDGGMLAALERLHDACLRAGQGLRAARTAFWAGFRLIPLGELARAQAWLGRAQRLVQDAGEECVERGYLLLPAMMRALASGDATEAERAADEACAIAERFADPDLLALARITRGRVLLQRAEVPRGLAELDDAMLSAATRQLSPVVTGLIYCQVIGACSQVYALDRAREWTAALSRWCEPQPQLASFAGTCMVHRAELLELQGAWGEALAEAERAEQRLQPRSDPKAMADAAYQRAEIHRLRGDLRDAEAVYAVAARAGREPQPGLSLLRLAQGRADVAASAMRRVLSTTREPLARARQLPGYVEIMLATGDLASARAARDELRAISQSYGTDVLRAICAQAHAAILLADGEADAAVEPLRDAVLLWKRIDAPYVIARLQVLLGRACRELGDEDGAELEWSAAREAFEALGARPDLEQLEALQRARPRPTPERQAAAPAAAPSDSHGLSARELEVLRLVATGKTNRAIARELCVSEKTVDRHVSNLLAKLSVSSRAAATAYAYEHGLVKRA